MSTLGVFDSGLGGFNIVAYLRAYNDADIVFLADHKNLPYGLKDDETLKAILKENLQWFKKRNIMHVFIACNTASNYIDYLREEFKDMTIDSIIEITAQQFEKEDLIVFGTNVTTKVKKYDQMLNKNHEYHALSQLASLVEDNDDFNTEAYLKDELKKYKNKNQNYLLACTHYSIKFDMFEKYLTGTIYDSTKPVIDYYKHLTGNRELSIYSTGNIKILSDQLKAMFGVDQPVLPHLDSYKMIVCSDNHGLYAPVENLIKNHKDAHLFIHCGDVQLNDSIMDKFYTVNGNNDYMITYPKTITLDVNGLKMYITHGDEYMRHNRLEGIYAKASSLGAKLVFYGHEHIYQETWMDDTLLLNPGSLYYNRDNTPPSYAIVHVNGDDVIVEHIEI